MPDKFHTEKPLHVAFIWHQHQPFYKDLLNNTYLLPWVRLHAIKDYYDMAAILDEFPAIHITFNLVPSLLIQLEDYAEGTAFDPHLLLTLKPAAELTNDDRHNILQDFFMANWKTMIEPHPRYNTLLSKKGRFSTPQELKRIASYFSTQDFLDLQVWFNLAWMGPYWRKHDPLIKQLFKKAARFTEEDKHKLVAKQREICGRVAHKHRVLQEKGQIEISTTPFYHPIMPLIIDTDIAQKSNPTTTLPLKRFNYPEDIEQQIVKSIDCYTRLFGTKPKGLWPSEGAVSESIMPILIRHGFKWLATDEKILFKSLSPDYKQEQLYKPYRIHNSEPPLFIFFRHQELSDSIGFNYANWDDQTAASDDFIKKLHRIRLSLSKSKDETIITIILDGENCWENYKNNGRDFLKNLYAKLSSDPLLKTVTISEFLNKHPSHGTLKKVWPGSWINANYDIWIGSKEKNIAWHYLVEARKFVDDHLAFNPGKKNLPNTEKAWEEIYIAEGSDWNWWYGDDNSSSNDAEFDMLFRKHLMNVYTLMDERIPDWLYVSIIKNKSDKKSSALPPVDLISPKIDGKITNYYEWQPAGFYKVPSFGSTMRKSECIVSSFHYGFDIDTLYFRIDTKIPLNEFIFNNITFKVVFLRPKKYELIFRIFPGGKLKEYGLFSSDPFSKIKGLKQFAAHNIIEFAVPFKEFDPRESFKVEFMIVIEKNLIELERWPLNCSIELEKPTKNYKMINWSV